MAIRVRTYTRPPAVGVFRPRARASRRGWLAFLVGVLALAVGFPTAPASARPTSPIDDADRRVDATRDAARATTDRYFARLAEFERLRNQTALVEAQIDDGEQRANELRRIVNARAVRAYVRSGSSLPFVLSVDDVNELMRSTKLLEIVNAHDGDAMEALTAANEDLRSQRVYLRDVEQRVQSSLTELRAAQRIANADLSDALRDHADIAARVRAQAARDEAMARSARRGASQNPAGTPAGGSTTTTPRRSVTPPPATPPPPSVPPPPPGSGVHPRHSDPFLSCTRFRESRGNYGVVNPRGPWYGAYQFLQSTWNITAQHAGRLALVGVVPSTASAYDQDDMAWTLYQWQGNGPWGGAC